MNLSRETFNERQRLRTNFDVESYIIKEKEQIRVGGESYLTSL